MKGKERKRMQERWENKNKGRRQKLGN